MGNNISDNSFVGNSGATNLHINDVSILPMYACLQKNILKSLKIFPNPYFVTDLYFLQIFATIHFISNIGASLHRKIENTNSCMSSSIDLS